jgi:hypothetical protein
VCVLSCAKVDYMKEDHKTLGPMFLCVCWVIALVYISQWMLDAADSKLKTK